MSFASNRIGIPLIIAASVAILVAAAFVLGGVGSMSAIFRPAKMAGVKS